MVAHWYRWQLYSFLVEKAGTESTEVEGGTYQVSGTQRYMYSGGEEGGTYPHYSRLPLRLQHSTIHSPVVDSFEENGAHPVVVLSNTILPSVASRSSIVAVLSKRITSSWVKQCSEVSSVRAVHKRLHLEPTRSFSLQHFALPFYKNNTLLFLYTAPTSCMVLSHHHGLPDNNTLHKPRAG